ncbi:MAG: hypothetical protein Q9213_001757 [Squamulea squamosa]
MAKNDPQLIVTLVAINTAAEIAWNQPGNRHRCLPGVTYDAGLTDAASRGTTPSATGLEERRASAIRLTFDNPPKNLRKGFVFGSNSQHCDVSLRGWSQFVSRQHFRITFNARGNLILEDTSKIPTCVVYNGERRSGRNDFTWILFRKFDDIEVTLNCNRGIVDDDDDDECKYKSETTNCLVFRLEWPVRRDDCETLYKKYLDAYLEECLGALPPLGQLGMESQQTTAVASTTQYTPRQQPIYLRDAELGYGGFGTVYKAVDVSTGAVYAAKKFHDGKWQKEVEILKVLSHEHIVKFVGCSEDHLLVMEYLPLGNLACQASVTEEDVLQILHQGLLGLEYLHSQGVAHRDIKPENILVQSKRGSTLKTFCGSDAYAAPEIWDGHSYTKTVDIWSLGVVIYEYIYGFPDNWGPEKRRGKLWCQTLERIAQDEEGVEMVLVASYMLRIDHHERLSATKCLLEVRRLGIDAIQITGCTKPARNTIGEVYVSETSEVSTSKIKAATVIQDKKDKSTTIRAKRQRAPKTQFLSANTSNPVCKGYRDSSGEEIVTKRPRATTHHTKAPSRQPKSGRQYRSVSLDHEVPEARDEKLSQNIEPASPSITGPAASQSIQGSSACPEHGIHEGQSAIPIEKSANIEAQKRQLLEPLPNKALSQASDDNPTKRPSPFFVINIASQPLTVRRSDLRIRAIDICRVTNTPNNELTKIKRDFPENIDVCHDFNHRGIYIDSWIGVELLHRYGLLEAEKDLCKLVDVPQKEQANDNQVPTQQCLPEFFEIKGLASPVMVRTADFRVNASHVFKVLGQSRTALCNFRNTLEAECYDIFRGHGKRQGTYVDFHIALELCTKHNLYDLRQRLYSLKRTSEDSLPVTAPPMQALESKGTHQDLHGLDSGRRTPVDHSPILGPQSMAPTVNAVSPYKLGSTDIDVSAVHQSVSYEVWDSQPEHSGLVEIKPTLKPSTLEAVSQYGESFGELFPPT